MSVVSGSGSGFSYNDYDNTNSNSSVSSHLCVKFRDTNPANMAKNHIAKQERW